MAGNSEPREYQWLSDTGGWHSRAGPHPSPDLLDFTKLRVAMASKYNAMAGSGFNMALFVADSNEHIAVDAAGRLLVLTTADATAFDNLIQKASNLSNEDYRIFHLVTCRPFTIVKIGTGADQFKTLSIYGYSKHLRDLEDGDGQLPDALWELAGLIEEAASSEEEMERNAEILEKVKDRLSSMLEG